MPDDPFLRVAKALGESAVRFLVIGVSGANYYARSASTLFSTHDYDLFLPPDPPVLVAAWSACESIGLALWVGGEPLDRPRDEWLAARIASRRALVRATDGRELDVDLSLVMAGFEFERAWENRRLFTAEGVAIPVASLSDIVLSKTKAGREKDRLFLAAHAQALEDLMGREGP